MLQFERRLLCGLSGKWHLGDNLHPREGFSFWVTKPHGATASLYHSQVIENGGVSKVEGYSTGRRSRLQTVNRNS